MHNTNIVSLFSGAGGLDLGFKQAGFNIVFANEFDKTIHSTFQYNFPNTFLSKKDVKMLSSKDIPDCVGIIGGPPCQSWSEAGALRGIQDQRGQLFYEYIRIINDKKPLFFVAENVSGLLHKRNYPAFLSIIKELEKIGYKVSYSLVNSKDYNVPQDRKRIFIVGFLKNITFSFPRKHIKTITLKDAIYDLQDSAKAFNISNKDKINHEYYVSSYSSIFMSRNRVRSWEEPSFTIQAGARHIPLHPQAPKMILQGKDKYIFKTNYEHLYRRLSVRECARIQTFPDTFLFLYDNVINGYKMVGNAVPVNLSNILAKTILEAL